MTEFIEKLIVASIVFVAILAYGLRGFDLPEMPAAEARADAEPAQDSNSALSGPFRDLASRPSEADVVRIRPLGN